MAYDVKVKISAAAPIGKASFGYPLILSVGKVVDYKECKTLAEVVEAGYANTTNTYKVAAIMLAQTNVPEKFAVMGVTDTSTLATDLLGKDFRQIMIVDGDAEDITAVATYVNATDDKMFFATTTNDAIDGVPAGERVIHFVHDDPNAVAALMGEAAGRVVGSFNYKCLMLNGIEPMEFTDTEIDAIHNKKAITFVTKAGDNVTSEATTTKGDFIDIIDIKDYVVQQIRYRTQRLLNTVDKITYDDIGIERLANVARTVMQECYGMGIIATVDGAAAYSVDYAKRADTTADERATRKYNGGKFTFTAAGAISYVEVNGSIEF